MRNRLVIVLLTLATFKLAAQSPNTEIYLAPLTRAGGTISVGAATNITNRPGYDNQPSFMPDSRAVLYTAIDSFGRADIWRYDLTTGRATRVTSTRESEYSATVMPDGARFSAIRVELDSTQRLWSFALDGTSPQLVLRDLKPIGYHAWVDSTRLAVFVLGTPSSLHLINRDGSGDSVIARNIGRSINRVPGRDQVTYTIRDGTEAPSRLMMTQARLDAGAPRDLGRVPADNEFHTWTPDGLLLTVSKGMLLRWNEREGESAEWLPVAELATGQVKNITRLSVSPDGKWLAFVAEPAGP